MSRLLTAAAPLVEWFMELETRRAMEDAGKGHDTPPLPDEAPLLRLAHTDKVVTAGQFKDLVNAYMEEAACLSTPPSFTSKTPA